MPESMMQHTVSAQRDFEYPIHGPHLHDPPAYVVRDTSQVEYNTANIHKAFTAKSAYKATTRFTCVPPAICLPTVSSSVRRTPSASSELKVSST